VNDEFVPVRSAFIEFEDGADMQRASSIITALQAPAPQNEIEKWLAVASSVMARSKRDHAENMLAAEVYVQALSDYPGDVVRQLLDRKTGIPRQMTFFPGLKELCDMADALMGDRASVMQEFSDPRFPREWWEKQVKDYLETTDWKISYVPGPDQSSCPMPADLLAQCHKALSRRRTAQEQYRKEMAETESEVKPQGGGKSHGKGLFNEPKVSREELDAKREAHKKLLLSEKEPGA
jgi:hypothetical protein